MHPRDTCCFGIYMLQNIHIYVFLSKKAIHSFSDINYLSNFAHIKWCVGACWHIVGTKQMFL